MKGVTMRPGDHVTMTPEAVARGMDGRHHKRTGVFLGPASIPGCISVKREGDTLPSSWRKDFWMVKCDED